MKDAPRFQARRERRQVLRAGLAAAAAGALTGCDALSRDDTAREILRGAERLSENVHRVLGRRAMAQEYPASAVAPVFRPNGTTMPPGDTYAKMLADGFASWRLQVGGLVARPLELMLAQVRELPARTQVTRHDCVEGWSCIGQWKGVQLSRVLTLAQPAPQAKFVVFHCLDRMDEGDEGSMYYESIDMDDAHHAQTILAYELNGAPLPVANGAPLRVRVERQLGYKQPKYVHRIELVESVAAIAGGSGGYWEDRDYNWYAGI